jgi:hypothetical protein
VNYTWVVTCDVEADLSDLGGISALEFESTVESNLNANSFERLLDLTVPSFTAMKEVNILLNTRRPTLQPTAYPSPLPTKDSKKQTNNPTSAILLSLLVVAVFAIMVLVLKNYQSSHEKVKEVEKKVGSPKAKSSFKSGPPKYVEPYLPRKSDSITNSFTPPPPGVSVVSSPMAPTSTLGAAEDLPSPPPVTSSQFTLQPPVSAKSVSSPREYPEAAFEAMINFDLGAVEDLPSPPPVASPQFTMRNHHYENSKTLAEETHPPPAPRTTSPPYSIQKPKNKKSLNSPKAEYPKAAFEAMRNPELNTDRPVNENDLFDVLGEKVAEL